MKKHKKMHRLAGGLVILAASGILLARLQGSGEETETKEMMVAVTADRMKTVSYRKADGEWISFTRSEGQWICDTEEEFSADQTKVGTMVSSMTGNRVSQTLSDVQDLSKYGLDEPSYEISVTDLDGENYNLLIGDTNEMTYDVYVLLNDDESTVYVVSAGILTSLDKTLPDYEAEETESVVELIAAELAESSAESAAESFTEASAEPVEEPTAESEVDSDAE